MVAKEFLDSDRVNFLVWRFVRPPAPSPAALARNLHLLAIATDSCLESMLTLCFLFCRTPDIYLKAVCDTSAHRARRGTSNPQTPTDYRETAAKFQKEWRVQKPHRDFPFARHVKSHALVSVVNRGLLYYALERDHARSQVSPLLWFCCACLHSRGGGDLFFWTW